MWKRKRTGSVVCPSCGKLVGVNDDKCYNCGRRKPGMWGLTPLLRSLGQDLGFTDLVIGICALLYVISLLMDPAGIGMRGLFGFLSPSIKSLFLLGASGAFPVFELGRWWTVLSATWLHGSLLHILFNMLWVRQLGPAAGEAYGAARMVIIFVTAGVTGFFLSSVVGHYLVFLPGFLQGARFTIGASASIFGLLGALVHYGRRRGSSALGSQALGYAVILGVFGFVMPGIDNWAHLGGFLGGYGTSVWLDPWKEERTDHVIAALVLLGLSLLAVVVSVVHGLSIGAGH